MKQSRLINTIVAVIFLVLTLAMPVRGLLDSRDVAAEAAARGTVVFNAEEVNSAARTADFIMLFLFGSLTLVFAWRAMTGRRDAPPPAPNGQGTAS